MPYAPELGFSANQRQSLSPVQRLTRQLYCASLVQPWSAMSTRAADLGSPLALATAFWRSLASAACCAAARAFSACLAASFFFWTSSSLAERRPVAAIAVRRPLRDTDAAARYVVSTVEARASSSVWATTPLPTTNAAASVPIRLLAL